MLPTIKKILIVVVVLLSAWFIADFLMYIGLIPSSRVSISSGVSMEAEPTEVPPSPTPKPNPKLSILVTGDLMYDRHIRVAAEENGYDYSLAPLTEFLQQYDLVLTNLEGPITDNPSRSVGSKPGSTDNYYFTFDPQMVDQVLLKNQMEVVNLGNNHILNFGVDGYGQTLSNLQAAGIEWFGQINLPQSSQQPVKLSYIWEKNSFKIALVNFNQFSGLGIEPVVKEIERLKTEESDLDLILTYPHWGNEYVPTANATIQNWAHQLIDAGAEVVIGAHPHVIQNQEEYQGKQIYYSLGNFVFDQYFQPEVKQGMLVELKLTKDADEVKVEFEEYLVELTQDKQTRLVD
jgi:gamma-polyglutamate biosynthesis protein CapA